MGTLFGRGEEKCHMVIECVLTVPACRALESGWHAICPAMQCMGASVLTAINAVLAVVCL